GRVRILSIPVFSSSLLFPVADSLSIVFFPYATLFRSGRKGRSARSHRRDRRARRRRGRTGRTPRGAGPQDRPRPAGDRARRRRTDRKSTRLNSSHVKISYAVFCLKHKIYLYIL